MLKKSLMTGKLEGIGAYNTSPLDNDYCNKMNSIPGCICEFCYSRFMLLTSRQNCRPAWNQNGIILSNNYINKEDTNINESFFRFHAHGELINYIHLENFMHIVDWYPETHFALWTKRTGLINKYFKHNKKQDNLQLIYSNKYINNPIADPPKYFDKIFNVYTKEYAEKNETNINCGDKKCIKCKLCYTKNNVKVINEIAKIKKIRR